jgi:hypothetical protein
LVGNSSYIIRNVGITCGDFKFQQTNPRVNNLICLLVFLLSELFD